MTCLNLDAGSGSGSWLGLASNSLLEASVEAEPELEPLESEELLEDAIESEFALESEACLERESDCDPAEGDAERAASLSLALLLGNFVCPEQSVAIVKVTASPIASISKALLVLRHEKMRRHVALIGFSLPRRILQGNERLC